MERKPTRFELRLPPDLADNIDAWRRDVPDIPPRAEAARRLIELGLAAYAYTQAAPGDDEERARSELLKKVGQSRVGIEKP